MWKNHFIEKKMKKRYRWSFQVKNYKKNYPSLLKEKRIMDKKLREDKIIIIKIHRNIQVNNKKDRLKVYIFDNPIML